MEEITTKVFNVRIKLAVLKLYDFSPYIPMLSLASVLTFEYEKLIDQMDMNFVVGFHFG